MNKIRALPRGKTLNYWCSWFSQNALTEEHESSGNTEIVFCGDQGKKTARNVLNERIVFGAGGFGEQWSPEIRKHMYLMLDDGWDFDYDTVPSEHIDRFGSLCINKQKFPSFTGNNAERLKRANDKAKELGWYGIGLWVAAQPCAPLYYESYDEKTLIDYYSSRILDCKYAGIRYWKVDWGKYQDILDFRAMLTELGHKLYPDLYIEHTRCCFPVNGFPEQGLFRYSDDGKQFEEMKKIRALSDVYRLYDVTENMLSATSTIDRAYAALGTEGGFVNCEDEVYIGAALGCSLGVMRSIYGNTDNCNRLEEVAAAVRWQNVAPAFVGGEINASDDVLTDTHRFEKTDTWYTPIIGKTVSQAAPSVIARNAALPTVVSEENMPFILASLNPSGAYSIAAIKRHCCYENSALPQVYCDPGDVSNIGIFGHFGKLTFAVNGIRSVKARCLISNKEKDVTRSIIFDDSSITVTDEFIREVCKPSDKSESAIELILIK